MRRWEEEEDNDKWGPHVIERRAHIQWNVRLPIHLQLGPGRLYTYFVAYLREVKNCNGKFQNTWIVVAFLQLRKIVMAWFQITLIFVCNYLVLLACFCYFQK
jgi:hypothetical protein